MNIDNLQYLTKYLTKCENILLMSSDQNIIKFIGEYNIKTYCIDKIENIKNIEENYDIIFNDLINLDLNYLTKLTKKFIILSNIKNYNDIKLFMELNDDWIYNNDDWTFKNNLTIIKRKEEHEKNIICIIKENAKFYNPKSFELFNYYFNNNYKMVNKNMDNIGYFIDEKNKKNNVLIFIHDTYLDNFDFYVLKHIQNQKKNEHQIYIIIQDWWVAANYKRVTEENFRKDILKANNYKIIVIVDNVEILADFNNTNCLEFKNNIICYNYWGIYKSSIIEFNKDPIKKIFISGCMAKNNYPERRRLKSLNNEYIYVYEYNYNDVNNTNNNYSEELNKYLCCFSSSVYVVNIKYGRIENTHLVLLKTFEILASGSLLLVPDYEEPYLEKLGLINKKHYLTLKFDKNDHNMHIQINNLFANDNLLNINNIRYNGYNYAINHLTNEQRYKELNELFIK
jgi:hypothetical protein